jgi:uncharacterized OB-fold protein
MYVEQTVLYGRKCPVCGRILAPFMMEFLCHGHLQQTATTTQGIAIPTWVSVVKTIITSSGKQMIEVKG